jgi:threonine dehydratase
VFWNELRLGTELAGAAALAVLRAGKIARAGGHIVCIVCGSGTDGMG